MVVVEREMKYESARGFDSVSCGRVALVLQILAPVTIREVRVGGVVLVPLGDQLRELLAQQQHLRRGVRLQ